MTASTSVARKQSRVLCRSGERPNSLSTNSNPQQATVEVPSRRCVIMTQEASGESKTAQEPTEGARCYRRERAKADTEAGNVTEGRVAHEQSARTSATPTAVISTMGKCTGGRMQFPEPVDQFLQERFWRARPIRDHPGRALLAPLAPVSALSGRWPALSVRPVSTPLWPGPQSGSNPPSQHLLLGDVLAEGRHIRPLPSVMLAMSCASVRRACQGALVKSGMSGMRRRANCQCLWLRGTRHSVRRTARESQDFQVARRTPAGQTPDVVWTLRSGTPPSWQRPSARETGVSAYPVRLADGGIACRTRPAVRPFLLLRSSRLTPVGPGQRRGRVSRPEPHLLLADLSLMRRHVRSFTIEDACLELLVRYVAPARRLS